MKNRLNKTDWISLGLKVLAKKGHAALSAKNLAEELEVSRGSFYWHFKDVGEFESSVLAAWRQRSTEDVIEALESGLAPATRLAALINRALGSNTALERAIRSWSASDKSVARIVAVVDQRRCEYIVKLLQEIGVRKPDIRPRALTLYWASLGRIMVTNNKLRHLNNAEVNRLVGLLGS